MLNFGHNKEEVAAEEIEFLAEVGVFVSIGALGGVEDRESMIAEALGGGVVTTGVVVVC